MLTAIFFMLLAIFCMLDAIRDELRKKPSGISAFFASITLFLAVVFYLIEVL